MDVVLEHFKEYYIAYILGAIVVLPGIYFTRRWTAPAILYAVEITVYLCLMHLAVWLVVGLTRWFKENSSMKALREDGRPVDSPDWGTPLLEFWKRAEYRPEWLLYVECVLLLIIIFLVWRYRPMRIQRRHKRRAFKNEAAAARGRQPGKPGTPRYPGAPGGKGAEY